MISSAHAQTSSTVPTTQHYIYALVNSGGLPTYLYVYDMDNSFALVKQVNVPLVYTGGDARGIVVSAATGMMYISHGCYYNVSACSVPHGYLAKYDLATDQLLWDKPYSFGIDSQAISPDGQTIYMPEGEASTSSLWQIMDPNGNVLGSIDSGQTGSHNTIVSNNGAHIYMGSVHGNYLVVVDTSTNAVIQKIGPTYNGVRPFTIDSTETYAFTTSTGLTGFQVGDIATGKILYTVNVASNFASKCSPSLGKPCSHGISISPDNKEIYLTDKYSNYVHVYDVSGLPGTAPVLVADIPLAHPYVDAGWATHSRDGRYVFIGDSGDVIDTSTRTIVAYLPALNQASKFQEVWLQNGATTFAPLSRSGVGYSASPSSPAPTVGLSSANLSFGSQTIGSTSSAQSTTLTNTGNASLTISSIAVTGTDSADFHETNSCGSSLAAGASCSISVTFSPAAAGTRTASVAITDNAGTSPQAISLSGTGASATTNTASVTPSSLSFGNVQAGSKSSPQTVTLSNTGNVALTVSSISVSNSDFSETSNCGTSLAVGTSCAVSVVFTPPAASSYGGTLTIKDSAASSSQTVSLTGTGTGVVSSAPAASFSPTSLTFTSQTVGTTSAPLKVTLSNTGNASLTISSLLASGDYAQTNTCGSSLAAGANCTISATFTPSATGTRTGKISVTDNATGSPQSVTLSGTGSSPSSGTVNHYEFVVMPGFLYVYDMDNSFALAKTISVPPTHTVGAVQIRGVVASAVTGMMYISYGSIRGAGGAVTKYNLNTDAVVWTLTYPFGIDSMSISPDGKTLYMPDGEGTSDGTWEVIDANTGSVTGKILSGGLGPHNTTTTPNGAHVYLGPRYTDYLVLADAATLTPIRNIGPTYSGVRPFTIDASETYAYITTSAHVGFYAADVSTGKVLYWVCPPSYCWTSGAVGGISGVSHGISLSVDESKLYLLDLPYNHVHVFDITGMPSSAPVDVADIPLSCKLTDEGWLQTSKDGRFVMVGNCGDVINTTTLKVVANMPYLLKTRIYTEVDFQNGVVSYSPLARN